jgi:osmoprotectant transport system ATP-binding protein
MQLVNVSHSYNGDPVIKNISWSAEREKITAIIGKSGSGKSTLLQFFNGLIQPSSGSVQVLGQPLNYSEITSTRLKIGYMVQGSGLFPHLTIEKNISIAGRINNSSSNFQSRVDELMKLVGLPAAYKSKYPYELSGGEQQRVAICRALFLDPDILLMDEPLGALDPIIRQEVQDEIIKLQQLKPRTILLVTHDMREAKAMAEFILVLDNGEVQQYGTRENVLQHPANALVTKLIQASL